MQSWRHHHLHWDVVTWTEYSLPPLRNQAFFDAADSLAQKSDIARYELLSRYGGVYLDSDFEALRSIDALLGDAEFVCASEDEIWLSIGFIGCASANPVMGAIVHELPASIARQPHAPINEQTGPPFFTRVVNRLRSSPTPAHVTVFPSALFYPYHFSEPERAGATFRDAYAVHHWSQGWDAT